MISKIEFDGLVMRLLKVTESGKITLWTERIAQTIKGAGIPVDLIDWSGSPCVVAVNVVSFSDKYEHLEELKTKIMELEEK